MRASAALSRDWLPMRRSPQARRRTRHQSFSFAWQIGFPRGRADRRGAGKINQYPQALSPGPDGRTGRTGGHARGAGLTRRSRRTDAMEEWICRQNIERWRSQLATVHDERQRSILLTLLAEEQKRLDQIVAPQASSNA